MEISYLLHIDEWKLCWRYMNDFNLIMLYLKFSIEDWITSHRFKSKGLYSTYDCRCPYLTHTEICWDLNRKTLKLDRCMVWPVEQARSNRTIIFGKKTKLMGDDKVTVLGRGWRNLIYNRNSIIRVSIKFVKFSSCFLSINKLRCYAWKPIYRSFSRLE